MPAYLIADIKITDDNWVSDYGANVHNIVHKYGGKYFSRSANIVTTEGEPLDTTVIALLEFPSVEVAKNFLNDPEYAPYAEARRKGSVSRYHIIDDTDAAGGIPYLPKG